WTIMQRDRGVRITVVEREDGWARHQTGNSGVIHSGIYYKPGSLKAKLCQEGNRRLVDFCKQYGIKFEICGKVIVATQPSELPLLENLFERGVTNGLSVRKLTAPQVLELEPHVRCLAGGWWMTFSLCVAHILFMFATRLRLLRLLLSR